MTISFSALARPCPFRFTRVMPPARYDSGLFYDTPGLFYDSEAPTTSTVMPNDNRISAAVTDAVVTDILGHIGAIHSALAFLVNLTPEEKRSLISIKTARAGMDNDFVNAMTMHPTLVPSYVNMTEVAKDKELRRQLNRIAGPSAELCEALNDTIALAAHDSMMAYLSFYSAAKEAAKRNVPGADTVVASLAQYFPRRGPTPPPPTP